MQILLIVVGFYEYSKFNIKYKLKIWNDVLLFPTIILGIFFFAELTKIKFESYEIGKLTSKALIPYLILCTALYFDIKRKIKQNGNLHFPYLLIINLFLVLAINLVNSYV